MSDDAVLLCMTAHIPGGGVASFDAYEARVLRLLGRHGGTLERRVAAPDGTFEMHLVRFTSQDGLERYRSDPERASAQPLLVASGAVVETVVVLDR